MEAIAVRMTEAILTGGQVLWLSEARKSGPVWRSTRDTPVPPAGRFQNGPRRQVHFAAQQHRAPLTAAGRSKRPPFPTGKGSNWTGTRPQSGPLFRCHLLLCCGNGGRRLTASISRLNSLAGCAVSGEGSHPNRCQLLSERMCL
jgi:hypothetical protein